MRAENDPRWLGWASAGLIALTLVLGVWPLVVGSQVPTWDAITFYAPAQLLVADFARQGKLLTWNPWLSGGRPDHADPQVGAASPLTIGMGWLTGGSHVRGFVAYWLLLWWLGGVGVLVLARSLGAPVWAGLIGGLAFVGCGFNTGHGSHTAFVTAFNILPWILWRLDVAGRLQSALAAAQAGALLGLAGLAGYPGVIILNGLFAAAWAAGRFLLPQRSMAGTRNPDPLHVLVASPIGKLRSGAIIAMLVGITCGGILAPTYSSFFIEGRDYSSRTKPLDRESAVARGALSPASMITMVSPATIGLRAENPKLWDGPNITLLSLYLTPAVLFLALIGFFLHPLDAWRWWLLALGLVFLAASLGSHLPVRGWLYDFVPPTRYFRFPAIFRGYWLFACVMLAVETSRRSRWGEERRPWLPLAVTSLLLGSVAWWLAIRLWRQAGEPLDGVGWSIGLAWLGPALIAAVALAGTKRHWRQASLVALVALAAIDTFSALRQSQIVLSTGGGELTQWRSIIEPAYQPSLDLVENGIDRVARSQLGPRNNGMLVVKQPRFQSYDPFRNLYHRAWEQDVEMSSLVTGPDRFWFATTASVTPLSQAREQVPLSGYGRDTPLEDFEEFRKRVRDLGAPVLLIHPRGDQLPVDGPVNTLPLGELPAMTRLAAKLESYNPETLILDIEAPADGWLLVTDRYARGWQATVDGKPIPLYRANFIFRAVPVEAGHHRVGFTYQVSGYRWLVALSWGILSVVLIGSCYSGSARK